MARGKAIELDTESQKRKLNEVKRVLCIAIKNIETRRFKSSTHMALLMGTTLSRLSEVHTLQYDKLTLTQLFNYLIKLDPNFDLQILFRYYSSSQYFTEKEPSTHA